MRDPLEFDLDRPMYAMGAALVAALASFLASACTRPRSNDASATSPPNRAMAVGSNGVSAIGAVPHGTPMAVDLNHGLGTLTSVNGNVFVARLQHPVRATDGTLVAPANARLVGRVVDVQVRPNPGLELTFNLLETVQGFAPIAVRVGAVEGFAWRETHPATAPSYVGVVIGEPVVDLSSRGPDGAVRDSGFRIPSGARITLEFVEPLALGRSAPPASETPICEKEAERVAALDEQQIDRLCGGLSSSSPVQCLERARDTRLSTVQAISLCRCAISPAPLDCLRQQRQDAFVSSDVLVARCAVVPVTADDVPCPPAPPRRAGVPIEP